MRICKTFLALCCVLVCLGFPGLALGAPTSDAQPQYDRLEWSTSGGGDLHFSVKKDGGNFYLERTRRQFHPAPLVVQLTAQSTQPQEKKIHALLTDLFSNPPVAKLPKKDDGLRDGALAAAGTWTSVSMSQSNGKKKPVAAVVDELDDRLQSLYQYVDHLPEQKR